MRSWRKGWEEGRKAIQEERKRKEEERKAAIEQKPPSQIAMRAGAACERAAPYIRGAKKAQKKYQAHVRKRASGPRPDPFSGLNQLSTMGQDPGSPSPQTAHQGRRRKQGRDPYDMSHLENMFR